MRRGGRAERRAAPPPTRNVNYRQLRNPFTPQKVFSDDRIEAIHEAALTVLETLGIKVLLPEARKIYRAAGAQVDDDSQMVLIGREIVAAALAQAPRSIPLIAGAPHRNVTLELGNLIFQPGAGAPHATDLTRGRRPGTARDFRELIQLTHHYGALHMLPPLVEPQAHDLANFGTWQEAGSLDTTTRATKIWQEILKAPAPAQNPDSVAALRAYIARRTEAGGAPPES